MARKLFAAIVAVILVLTASATVAWAGAPLGEPLRYVTPSPGVTLETEPPASPAATTTIKVAGPRGARGLRGRSIRGPRGPVGPRGQIGKSAPLTYLDPWTGKIYKILPRDLKNPKNGTKQVVVGQISRKRLAALRERQKGQPGMPGKPGAPGKTSHWTERLAASAAIGIVALALILALLWRETPSGALKDLKDRAKKLEGRATGHGATMAKHGERLDRNAGELETLGEKANEHEEGLNTLKCKLAAVTQTVDEHGERLDRAETALEELKRRAAGLPTVTRQEVKKKVQRRLHRKNITTATGGEKVPVSAA